MANARVPGRILLGWNWKTALLSGCFRAVLFAAVSWRAGEAVALRTGLLEIALTVALACFWLDLGYPIGAHSPGRLAELFGAAWATSATAVALVMREVRR